ncbi:hypothetical protein [Streptomyces sp. NPDC048489]|uniref:hypothetical protein n=1 Tax=Streptomyces sp. NPDC048489 TaxID=3154504 RepID=UPI0034230014
MDEVAQIDETVVSWAACLLADRSLALLAHAALATTDHHAEAGNLQRVTNPSSRDIDATPQVATPTYSRTWPACTAPTSSRR